MLKVRSKICLQCTKRLKLIRQLSSSTAGSPQCAVWKLNSNNIYDNLALENWVYENMSFENKSLMLLWRNEPCVVIGRHQNTWSELNVKAADRLGVNIARRSSGGGTVYHDLGNICISFFTARVKYNRKSNLELILNALRNVYPFDVSINCRDDLMLKKKYKISGTAAKLGRKVAYHHCTLLHDVGKAQLHEILHSTMKGIESNATDSVRSEVMNLTDVYPNITYDAVCDAIAQQFLINSDNKAVTVIDSSDSMFPGIQLLNDELQSWEVIFGKTPKFKISRHFNGLLGHLNISLNFDADVIKGRLQNVHMKLEGSELADRTCELFAQYLDGIRFCLPEVYSAISRLHADADVFDQCNDVSYSWIAMCLNELFH